MLIISCSIRTSNAQSSFTGVVKTENNQILSSASVTLVDSLGSFKQTTTTNTLGTFLFSNIPFEGTYKLIVSSIGYDTFIYPNYHPNLNNPKFSLLIRLSEASATVDEVVVVAYGTQKQREVTGAISKINTDDISSSSVTSVDQFIAGKAAGVQVYETSGQPGGNAAFRIRGVGSITAGTQPLIVIDGLPSIYGSNLSSINHSDIASIEILKDAAATSLYGSRASNGVVLITTKRGETNSKTKIEFNSIIGYQKVAKEIQLMDAYQRASINAAAANNYWVSLNPTVNKATDSNNIRTGAAIIPDFAIPYLQGQKGLTNTNWQDVIFKDARLENYNLSVSGGSPKSQFYLSGNYLNQNGTVVYSGYKRYATRFNFNTVVSPKVRLGINLAPSYSKFNKVSQGSLKKDGVIFSALLQHPHLSPYNPDGSIALNLVKSELADGIAPIENPLALAKYNQNKVELARVIMGGFIEVDVLKNLIFKTFASGDYYSNRTSTFHPSFLATYGQAATTQSSATSSTQRVYNYIVENTLNFTKSFNKHHFQTLIGYTFQKENTQNNSLSAINFPNNQVTTLNVGTINGGSSTEDEWSLVSYLARLNYNYQSKYLIAASIREDGSSRFGPESRWGWFPSFSAGWHIKDESFMKSFKPINDLKIRGSYGSTGNFFIPNHGFLALLATTDYVLGNTSVNGLSNSTAPNSNLSWEKTNTYNIGFDAILFKDKLRVSVDYYNAKTKALLLNVPVPAQSGYTSSLQNLGKVQNDGVEVGLSTKLKIGKAFWSTSANFATNKNKVLELGPSQTELISGTTNISRIGNPLGAFYGYHIVGVFKNQADLTKYTHLNTSQVGDYIYSDENHDGIINDKDRVIMGKSLPDIFFGFSNTISYKHFELSFLVQGSLGFQIYNQLRTYTINEQGFSNGLKSLYDGYFQSATNPGNGFAAPNVKPHDKLYETSDYMVENGDFIRVRSMSLSYTLPKKITNKLFKASLFISGKNLFTITKYSGYNPEVSNNGSDAVTPGIDYGVYPVEKNIVFGTKISF